MLDLFMVLENIECNGVVVDKIVPTITVTVVNVIKIIVPVLLIIFGMMDLMKAVTAGDEKVMKEAQKKLISRALYALLIFLLIAFVQTVFGMLGKADEGNNVTDSKKATSCIACFITDTSKCTPQGGVDCEENPDHESCKTDDETEKKPEGAA